MNTFRGVRAPLALAASAPLVLTGTPSSPLPAATARFVSWSSQTKIIDRLKNNRGAAAESG